MSNALTAAELASMRSTITELLPTTCIILTGTAVADGAGEETITWGTTTTNVACRLDPQRITEQVAGAAVQPFSQYMLTVPYDTTLTAAMRVKIGTISYNIISVTANNSWALDKRAVVEKA